MENVARPRAQQKPVFRVKSHWQRLRGLAILAKPCSFILILRVELAEARLRSPRQLRKAPRVEAGQALRPIRLLSQKPTQCWPAPAH